jgi:hypothetical protein
VLAGETAAVESRVPLLKCATRLNERTSVAYRETSSRGPLIFKSPAKEAEADTRTRAFVPLTRLYTS